ncbi:M23 family metallopeptidase [Leucobacter chromiireducens]|uniref:M23 family metallopeptidase n=1 Tax=Leucobacter chromiireducens TaxID=283877 RepID=UPI003F80FC42
MPDSSSPAPKSFPSRRALREAAAWNAAPTEPQQQHVATQPEAPEALEQQPARPAAQAPAVTLPEPPVEHDGPITGGYVRVPLPERDLSSARADDGSAPRARRPLRRRIAAAAAAASVGGLVLSAAVPLTQGSEDEVVAAATQQRLFSEVSPEDIPASLAEITAVDVDEAIAGTYAYRARALVNYPFQQSVLLTDPFGYRTAPVEQFHDAQDFGAAAGTPIYAIADGTVLEAGFASDGCGFGLKLEHEIDGKEVTSRYCHMQDASHSYSVGDTLMMGDPVGRVGATGMAFGAHLHLALRVDDQPADPMPFLAKYSRMDRDEKTTTKNAPATAETRSGTSS